MINEEATEGSTVEASPLLEAKAESLDELFSRDPEQLNEKDIEKIVTELRRQRSVFLKMEDDASKAPKARKSVGPKETLSLKDLGLE